MNSLFIGLGGAIVLALLAALIGPLFVDWTAHRAAFEREATRLLGHPVTVLGNVDVRLLPLPSLTMTDVFVGDIGKPLAKVAEFDARIEIAPLLKGEIRVADLRLGRPELRATLDRDGRLDWLTGRAPGAVGLADAATVSIGELVIAGGRLDLDDRAAGRVYTVQRLNGRIEAASLLGPFRFEGDGQFGEERTVIRLATGRLTTEGTLPLKLQLPAGGLGPALTFDGTLAPARPDQLAAGTLVLTQAGRDGEADPALAYRLEARATLRPGRLDMETLAVQLGAEDRGLALSGKASVDLGRNRRFEAVFATKQIDLDRVVGLAGAADADLARALAHLETGLRRLPVPPLPGRIVVDAGGVVVGGGLVRELHLDVSPRGRGWAIDALDAHLPGRTRIAARGMLSTERGLGFRGHVALASEQPPAFAQWWRRSAEAPDIPPLTLDAEVEAREGVLSVAGMDLMLGDASVRGAAEWSGPAGDRRFEARFSADSLDLDRLRTLARLLTGAEAQAGTAHTRIELDAGTVNAWGATAQRVGIAFERHGDDILVERLAIGDVGGLAVDAAGNIATTVMAPVGNFSATLKGTRLEGLETLLAGLGVEEGLARRLVTAARAGGAVDLTLTFEGKPAAAGADAKLGLTGQLGPSRIDLALRLAGRPDHWREARTGLDLKLAGPDAALLLRQVGLDVAAPAGGAGQLTLTLDGVPASGLTLAAGFDAYASKVSARGRVMPGPAGLAVDGLETRLESRDLTPLAQALGIPFAGLDTPLPVQVRATLSGTADRIVASALTGTFDGVPIQGAGTLAVSSDLPRLEARIDAASIDAESLVELGLGPDALRGALPATGPWTTRRFRGPVFRDLVADVALTTPRLALVAGRAVSAAKLRLTLRPGEVRLDDLSGEIAGGRLTGSLRLRPEAAGTISIAGSLRLAGVILDQVLPAGPGGPPLRGRADLTTSFEGAGVSLATAMASLTGEGAIELGDLVIARLDPGAIERIIRATDEGLSLEEPRIRTTLASFLDTGPLPVRRATATLAAAGGVLRLKDLAAESPRARVWGGGALDLTKLTLDATLSLRVDPGKEAVPGADPEFAVVLKGPLAAPTRSLDVTPLATYLTLRAVDREVKKIEAMQVELHERGRFDRELRHLRRQRLEREAPAAPPVQPAAPAAVPQTAPAGEPRAAAPVAPQAAPAAPPVPPTLPVAPPRRTLPPAGEAAEIAPSPAPPPLPPPIRIERPPPVLAPTPDVPQRRTETAPIAPARPREGTAPPLRLLPPADLRPQDGAAR